MNGVAISQDELNRLLMNAKENKAPAPQTAFNRTELLQKFNNDIDLLKKMLKEYNITVSQEEVDALLGKN